MQLNPEEFNQFLAHIGQSVTWRRSFACPCFDVNSGAARSNCPQCKGKGRIWDEPVGCVVGIAGQKVQKEWAQFGQWESGDAVVSIPSDAAAYEAGQFDRIVMLNATDAFSETLTHDGDDRLYLPVSSINRVFWLDPITSAVVGGGIPTVAADGVLTWLAGEPPAGAQYCINGRRFSEYFVFNALPSNRNEHQGAPLPRKVVLRKYDLFGR